MWGQMKLIHTVINYSSSSAPSGTVFVCVDRLILAGNARPMIINEGPLTLILSLSEKAIKGHLCVAYRLRCDIMM